VIFWNEAGLLVGKHIVVDWQVSVGGALSSLWEHQLRLYVRFLH